jgi:hypothetical protein
VKSPQKQKHEMMNPFHIIHCLGLLILIIRPIKSSNEIKNSQSIEHLRFLALIFKIKLLKKVRYEKIVAGTYIAFSNEFGEC